jgi:hypothetical protein
MEEQRNKRSARPVLAHFIYQFLPMIDEQQATLRLCLML